MLTANHVSHLENVSEEEINRLLGMVVDVENLFMSVHKEEDTDTKQVYFYLFKVGNEGSCSWLRRRQTSWSRAAIYSPLFFLVAAEEMHPSDEPAGGRGFPR